jgi:hypothetical protein
MYVWGASEQDIREAAKASGVAIFGDWSVYVNGITRTGKTERSSLHFRLALGTERVAEGYMDRERDDNGKLKPKKLHPMLWHRRTSNTWSNSERRVASVCWHGHYAFMRYLLALRPDARIKTSMADYHGLKSFFDTAPETGYRNIGSAWYPCCMVEACFCADYGKDWLQDIDESADIWAMSCLQVVGIV